MSILFIDDDPDDTELFCEAVDYLNNSEFIAREKEKIECITINDGCKAIDFLPKIKPLPEYIFLDINMPVMGGKECLKYLKTHPAFLKIPVIMLSTAFKENDLHEYRSLGASDCIRKPGKFNELVKVLSKYVYGKFT